MRLLEAHYHDRGDVTVTPEEARPPHALVPFAAALAYLVSFVVLLAWPPLTLLVLLVTWPFDRNRRVAGRFYRQLGVIWSRSFPFWRIRFEGHWPRGDAAHVVVANHQSLLDTFVLCKLPREMKWVAKKQLFAIPLFGWGLSLAGDICLERGDTASALAVMRKARRYLATGMNVMIFPEGTRSEDGTLLPFKPGAFKLAVEAGAPVLPIAISGTAHGMPKGSPWVRPATITVRILEPVPTAGLLGRDVRRLREDVRDRIADALGAGAARA
jgi:1-acyl-sn-glycerol-3-phosphate acyltransferase